MKKEEFLKEALEKAEKEYDEKYAGRNEVFEKELKVLCKKYSKLRKYEWALAGKTGGLSQQKVKK